MRKLPRMIFAAAVLLVIGMVPVFANGQSESSRLSGMITSIQPAATPNMVTVVLSNKYGNVTVTVSKNVETALSLKLGQPINVKGARQFGQDGMESIDPTEMEAGGKTLTITPNETVQPEQFAMHAAAHSSTDRSQPEHPETPEHHGGSSSHDSGSSHDN